MKTPSKSSKSTKVFTPANKTNLNLRDIMRVVQANPEYGTRRIAFELGVGRDVVRRVLQNENIKLTPVKKIVPKEVERKKEVEKELTDEEVARIEMGNLEKAKAQSELSTIKKANKFWMNEYAKLADELKVFKQVFSQSPINIGFAPRPHSIDSESIPVLMCSDWHIEEPVDGNAIQGLNEYNLDIADKSIENLAQRALKLINLKRAGTKIDKMVLWLGGDFISGHIHDELKTVCSLTPIEATLRAESRILNMIRFILDHGNFKELIIPCSVGNHARTTEKMQFSLQSENSYEWAIYHHLADMFKADKRVKFVLQPGLHCIITLFEKYKLRFSHGDAIKYGSGVGGITIPVNKLIANWDKGGNESYLDIFGHWHTFMPNRRFIINGSMIGYNAYARRFGFPFETPVQGLFYIEANRGLTSIEPVFLR